MNFKEIYENEFKKNLEEFNVMAIQDDYYNWSGNRYLDRFGKPILIDQSDVSTQHIFFDDNAKYAEKNICDVRDVYTGEILEDSKYRDKYVCRVEPHRCILEEDYFLRLIATAENKRDLELA